MRRDPNTFKARDEDFSGVRGFSSLSGENQLQKNKQQQQKLGKELLVPSVVDICFTPSLQ